MTTTTTPDAARAATDPDPAQVEAFAGELLGFYTGGMLSLMTDLGHRTGLFAAAAAGPATSSELAQRAGLQERYVREWLGAMVTGGVFDHDPGSGQYILPPAHAACLTGVTSVNIAPLSQLVGLLGTYLDEVGDAFRHGGGVPYERFRPRFTGVMDSISRGGHDDQLIDGILPLTGDLPARLAAGARAADIGCGTGHTTNLLAAAYPGSTFVGYDLAEDAIAQARAEAAGAGRANVSFEVRDVTTLPDQPPFDAVFAFDAIHDQRDPAGVLEQVYRALAPGGVFVMQDIKAASDVTGNRDNPLAPMLYAISTMHCMTVSLADGGAGLGTVWGEQLARQMLAEAGFGEVTVHDVPDDPLNSLYVCHKPA